MTSHRGDTESALPDVAVPPSVDLGTIDEESNAENDLMSVNDECRDCQCQSNEAVFYSADIYVTRDAHRLDESARPVAADVVGGGRGSSRYHQHEQFPVAYDACYSAPQDCYCTVNDQSLYGEVYHTSSGRVAQPCCHPAAIEHCGGVTNADSRRCLGDQLAMTSRSRGNDNEDGIGNNAGMDDEAGSFVAQSQQQKTQSLVSDGQQELSAFSIASRVT